MVELKCSRDLHRLNTIVIYGRHSLLLCMMIIHFNSDRFTNECHNWFLELVLSECKRMECLIIRCILIYRWNWNDLHFSHAVSKRHDKTFVLLIFYDRPITECGCLQLDVKCSSACWEVFTLYRWCLRLEKVSFLVVIIIGIAWSSWKHRYKYCNWSLLL